MEIAIVIGGQHGDGEEFQIVPPALPPTPYGLGLADGEESRRRARAML